MKRVIRLTESDLTRIVKRVIKEQSSGVVKVRGWDTLDGMTKETHGGWMLDITNIHLENMVLKFNYAIPGTTSKGTGLTMCRKSSTPEYDSIALTINNQTHQLFLTPVGYKNLTQLCRTYAGRTPSPTETPTNGDYA